LNFDSFVHVFGIVFQVSALDLLLSGDNALVIALACLSLPSELRGRAVMLGTGLAIVLRTILTGVVGYLMLIPWLKLLGGMLLLAIAIKLLLQEQEQDAPQAPGPVRRDTQLMQAIMIVVSADLALSLDNVVAVAAAAQGSFVFMALGLLLSMPLLMYGSLLLSRLLDQYPLLVPAGSALLGWIGGQIALSDPLIADWVNTQAPALTVVVPLLCVIFVMVESRIIRAQSRHLVSPPPLQLSGWLATQLFPSAHEDTAAQTETRLAPAEPGLSPSITPAPMIAASPPAAALEVAAIPAPTARPATTSDAPAARARKVDPATQSSRLALVIKIALGLAAALGGIALIWVLLHLFSQGVLPPPEHKPL
jgi:YjbE family integral membrane protein